MTIDITDVKIDLSSVVGTEFMRQVVGLDEDISEESSEG